MFVVPKHGAAPPDRLAGFFAQHRHIFLIAGLFSLFINLALLAPAIYMLQVFDRVLTSRSVETLVMLSLITAGALGMMLILDYLRGRLLAVAGVLLERRLGGPVLNILLRDVSRLGQTAYAYGLRDLGLVRAFLSGTGIVAIYDLPWMIIYVALIYVFSPALGLISLLGAALLVLVAFLNERFTRQTLERIQTGSRDTGRFVEAALRNAEVVGALGMAPSVVSRWQGLGYGVLQQQFDAGRLGGLAGSGTKFLRQAIQSLVLGVGAYLVIEQKATPGVMIAATIILGRALAPVEALIGSWKSLVDARAAHERLRRVLGQPASAGPQTDLPEPAGAVTLENVSFAPPGAVKPIVRGVNLQIAPGEVVAIVGPSGSGKSTLARLAVGVWPPTAGTVRVDGADIAAWNRERLGGYLGYLPQDVQLFAGTVADNIARLGEPDSGGVIRAAQRAHAHEMLLRLPQGYDTSIGEAGLLLSGGQRQRVALARALYGEPRIVVLDEPNAFLDTEGEQALAKAIEELKADRVTVILITQRSGILGLADRIVVLKDGIIEKLGVRSDAEGRNVGEVQVVR
jgi:PrtD family type I secretion system ABC transporter